MNNEGEKVDLPRLVVCAANRAADGIIICGTRHFDSIMRNQILLLRPEDEAYWNDHRIKWNLSEQGFLDNRGNFLTREEALTVATQNNQIRRRVGGDHNKLFSENLY